MSTAPIVRPKPLHLSEAQRAVLLDLIAAHPQDTIERIRARFAERAGRTVAAETVRSAWIRGFKPPEFGPRLSERQRATLEALCATLGRSATLATIAREFTAATGRGINLRTVATYRRLARAGGEVAPC